MSDQRLRELGRRWRTTNASEAAAAYLAERLRVEPEHQWRVRAAAYAGDARASLALGAEGPGIGPSDGWAEGLARYGRDALVAAALGVIAPDLTPFPELLEERIREWDPRHAFGELQRWLERPTPEGAERLLAWTHRIRGGAIDLANEGAVQSGELLDAQRRLTRMASVVLWTARIVDAEDPGRTLLEALSWAEVGRPLLDGVRPILFVIGGLEESEAEVEAGLHPSVLERARAAVVAWALGPLLGAEP